MAINKTTGGKVTSVALIDPFWSGHHSTYIKLFSEAILSLGFEVVVFCKHPRDIETWVGLNCVGQRDKIRCFELGEPEHSRCPVRLLRPALNALSLWRSADQALKKAHSETGSLPDLVFFPWMDDYLGHYQSRYVIDLIFPYNWSGLYFHPNRLRQRARLSGGPLDQHEILRSRRCKAVAVLDEGIAHLLQGKLNGKPVVTFPDVADTSPPDRDFPLRQEITAKARGRKIITLIGSLARRKGVLTLLEVAQKTCSENWFFLFAGKLAEGTFSPDELKTIKAMESNPPQNCFFHLDFIPEESQINALVEISDLLLAVYDGFLHSSNMLTKAANFKKPVIVGKGHCLAERAHAYQLGACIDQGSVSEYIDAIRSLLSGKDPQANFQGYIELHSTKRLAIAFKELCNYSLP